MDRPGDEDEPRLPFPEMLAVIGVAFRNRVDCVPGYHHDTEGILRENPPCGCCPICEDNRAIDALVTATRVSWETVQRRRQRGEP